MFQLFQLLLRFSSLFVFVVLEIVCFLMVVKYNQRQSDVYFNTVNQFTGFLDEKTSRVYQYFKLYDENVRLARENARLFERLTNAGIRDTSLQDSVFDDKQQLQYLFMPAKVIRNSTNSNHNYLILDKGEADGVVPNSGVVTDQGTVGIVRKVSKHYCVAMSVLHRQTKVSARIRNKGFFGPLTWKGTDPSIFNLEDIPKHAPVAKADTVETSGYSSLFPKGVMIGTIEKLSMEPGSNFFNITVRSHQDMSNLQHVYIVKNLLAKEQEQLEKAVLQEDE
jgi:rod shape-determining protein MreC